MATFEERLAAILARDTGADGGFVYGVRTTGVYCRPGCPGRRPRRENIEIFADPATARAAGYRACRRCHPDTPRPAPRFATAATSLGRLLVAAGNHGLRAVLLGESIPELEAALRERFAKAVITADEAGLAKLAASLVALVETPGTPPPDLAIELEGSPFETAVWRALQQIPAGETRSYAAIARALGRPTAARAVARACARNPLALLVPCHRVVRGDGGLGGYRWGVARKRALLAREGALPGREAGPPARHPAPRRREPAHARA